MALLPPTPSWTNMSFVDSPDPLTGHCYSLDTLHVFVGKRCQTGVKMSCAHQPTLLPSCLRVSVTTCAVIRFTCFHLHMVRDGLRSYILETGSGRTDGHDLYGVIGFVPKLVVFGIGMQPPRCLVMTRRPNAGARRGCCLYSLKIVCFKVGELCLLNPYSESVRQTV